MILENNISDIESLKGAWNQINFKSRMEVNLFCQDFKPCLVIRVASELLPVSWFITCDNGVLVKSGVSYKSHLIIPLSLLSKGKYTLRMKGEKFVFDI